MLRLGRLSKGFQAKQFNLKQATLKFFDVPHMFIQGNYFYNMSSPPIIFSYSSRRGNAHQGYLSKVFHANQINLKQLTPKITNKGRPV